MTTIEMRANREMHRRAFLRLVGAGSAGILAGCTSTDEEEERNGATETTTEDEESEPEPEPVTETVTFKISHRERGALSGLIVYPDIGGPYFESPPTDEHGQTVAEVPSGTPYSIAIGDEEGNDYMLRIMEAEPDNQDTERDRLLAREEMTVWIIVWGGEGEDEDMVISP